MITLSTCPILAAQKPTSFLHYNQIFDVIIEKVIVTKKSDSGFGLDILEL